MTQDAREKIPVVGAVPLKRREMILGALGFGGCVALTWATQVLLGVPGQSQQGRLTGNVLNSPLSGNGQDIIGNAVGNFPPAAIHAAQLVTGVVIVRHRGDDIASIGTIWKADFSNQDQRGSLCPTARHVLTRGGAHTISEIDEIWIGRPRNNLGFAVLRAADLEFIKPPYYDAANPAHDAAIVRIPDNVAPKWLAEAAGLQMAEFGAAQAGDELLLAGAPANLMPEPTEIGLEVMPLYASVMPMLGKAPVVGCIGVRGDVVEGISGSSITDQQGRAVGLVTAWRNDHTVVAVPADTLAQLAVSAS